MKDKRSASTVKSQHKLDSSWRLVKSIARRLDNPGAYFLPNAQDLNISGGALTQVVGSTIIQHYYINGNFLSNTNHIYGTNGQGLHSAIPSQQFHIVPLHSGSGDGPAGDAVEDVQMDDDVLDKTNIGGTGHGAIETEANFVCTMSSCNSTSHMHSMSRSVSDGNTNPTTDYLRSQSIASFSMASVSPRGSPLRGYYREGRSPSIVSVSMASVSPRGTPLREYYREARSPSIVSVSMASISPRGSPLLGYYRGGSASSAPQSERGLELWSVANTVNGRLEGEPSVGAGHSEEVAITSRWVHSRSRHDDGASFNGGEDDTSIGGSSAIERGAKPTVTTGRATNASIARRKQEANFACTIPGCNSTFTRGFNRKGHPRSHFEQNPYKCHWPGCGKGFARQHDYKRHEQLHTDLRPFECDGCKKQFARMDALNRQLGSEAGAECAKVVAAARAGAGSTSGYTGVADQDSNTRQQLMDNGMGDTAAWDIFADIKMYGGVLDEGGADGLGRTGSWAPKIEDDDSLGLPPSPLLHPQPGSTGSLGTRVDETQHCSKYAGSGSSYGSPYLSHSDIDFQGDELNFEMLSGVDEGGLVHNTSTSQDLLSGKGLGITTINNPDPYRGNGGPSEEGLGLGLHLDVNSSGGSAQGSFAAATSNNTLGRGGFRQQLTYAHSTSLSISNSSANPSNDYLSLHHASSSSVSTNDRFLPLPTGGQTHYQCASAGSASQYELGAEPWSTDASGDFMLPNQRRRVSPYPSPNASPRVRYDELDADQSLGAELWSTSNGDHPILPNQRRVSPYPSPSASPRVRYNELDADDSLDAELWSADASGHFMLPNQRRASPYPSPNSSPRVRYDELDGDDSLGAELWSTSNSSQFMLSNQRRVSPYPSPNVSPRVRYNELDADDDLGAELWSADASGHVMLPKQRRASPYPSPNASPRVRYSELDADDGLDMGASNMGIAGGMSLGALGDLSSGLNLDFPESGPLGILSGAEFREPPVSAGYSEEVAITGRRAHSRLRHDDTSIGGSFVIEGVAKPTVTTGRTANASIARRKQEANFACTIPGCNSTFTRSFNLKGHLRSHFEQKPYKCYWPGCGKGFARQHDCKRHEQLHSNFRPFECDGCKKQFARMDTLNRHLRSETSADCAQVVEAARAAGTASGYTTAADRDLNTG